MYVCYCGKRKYDIFLLDIFLLIYVNYCILMIVGKIKECFVMKVFRDFIKVRRKFVFGFFFDLVWEGFEFCRKFLII